MSIRGSDKFRKKAQTRLNNLLLMAIFPPRSRPFEGSTASRQDSRLSPPVAANNGFSLPSDGTPLDKEILSLAAKVCRL